MVNEVFSLYESNVRSYCRRIPSVFSTAAGSWIEDIEGRRFIDFLSGAGTLNYGHNNPNIMQDVVAYLQRGGIMHSLDMHTQAKADFIETFQSLILKPRDLRFKMQFSGPTGANAVEAALKLARKVTGRSNVVSFTNGFHGMSLGALSVTADAAKRRGAGLRLGGAIFMPYDGYLGERIDTLEVIEPMLTRAESGVDAPAAIIVELIQGEGGLNAASERWIRGIAQLARKIAALLIIDDIQAGVGRTGAFFSFESFGIHPDIVLLSKSLSGIGTPFSLVLLRPEHDLWQPGEHNGTFRGNNLGFVGATSAIRAYWNDADFAVAVTAKADHMRHRLDLICNRMEHGAASVKGRGMMSGISFANPNTAAMVADALYGAGMIIETCGERNQVLKLLPPLTISSADLDFGLDLIEAVIAKAHGLAYAST